MNTELLSLLPFWAELTQEEKNTVAANAVLCKYSKGEIIYTCEGNCREKILLVSGQIRAFMLSAEGRELTLYHLKGGDFNVPCSECLIKPMNCEIMAEAQTECVMLEISSFVLNSVMERNIVMKCMMFRLAFERYRIITEALQQILLTPLEQRLAKFLIDESDRIKSTLLKTTHEEIAHEISSAREVVARALKKLSLEDVVTIRRGCIEITDREYLRSLAS